MASARRIRPYLTPEAKAAAREAAEKIVPKTVSPQETHSFPTGNAEGDAKAPENSVPAGISAESLSRQATETLDRPYLSLKCTGCTHPDRDKLDADLLAMVPHHVVAKRYGLGRQSVARHAPHLTASVARGRGAGAVDELRRRAREVADRARRKGNHAGEVAALKELRAVEELEIRLSVERSSSQQLTASPAWQVFLRQVLDAVGGCAGCRERLEAASPSRSVPEEEEGEGGYPPVEEGRGGWVGPRRGDGRFQSRSIVDKHHGQPYHDMEGGDNGIDSDQGDAGNEEDHPEDGEPEEDDDDGDPDGGDGDDDRK